VGGELHPGRSQSPISKALTDSRKLSSPNNSIFFALQTKANNGHQYIQQLIDKGVNAFVVSDERFITNGANFILVRDSKKALQKWASFHRDQFDIEVVGVTGSNGKTIVKEWLYQTLEADLKIVRSPKSYNSQIGVPLSLLQIKEHHELGIFEAGISEPVEMMSHVEMIKPTIGVFTNIGDAHAAGFLSIEQKLNEKLQLFNQSKVLIYCEDHSMVAKALKGHKAELVSWGKSPSSKLRILNQIAEQFGTRLSLRYGTGEENEIFIPFQDSASIENAMHCVAFMYSKGYDVDVINERIKELHPIEMRLFQKDGHNNTLIIQDFYNSDFQSLEIALDFANRQHRGGRLTLILSDILQSDADDELLYRQVAELLNAKGVKVLIGIGPKLIEYKWLFKGIESQFFNSTSEYLSTYRDDYFKNETVVLKGARKFSFERISRKLEHKLHRTVLEINLNALAMNLNTFRAALDQNTKIMAMVKAQSYGSGGHQIAKLLESKGVDYLAVAYTQEGVELRKDGITLPIMVMNPEEDNLDQLLEYNLQANVYSFTVLEQLVEAVQRTGSIKTKVHLEFNTGMARLGFDEEDIEQVIEQIKNQHALELISVFSHLAAADESKHNEFTVKQCESFGVIAERFKNEFGSQIIAHILNSAGAIDYPEFQFDMIRLGIGLYGINPTSSAVDLENVYTFKSYISQIRYIPSKQSVGYGRRSISDQDRRVAILPLGYADGLNRLLSNGNGAVRIKGVVAPIVGNICMDMCMVDVSHINCEEGDMVVIFDSQAQIEEFAEVAQTIPYEVLTSIAQRVQRVFIEE